MTVRDWLEETHGSGFELCRHFFLSFFDSDLVATPGQWRAVAAGAVAIFASLSLAVTQAYYSKYLRLLELDTGEPFRLAILADHLFFITMSMLLAALFTVLQWNSLFPGLRDYLALAGLPVRPRQIFIAKGSALLAFTCAFVVPLNLLPSLMLSAVSLGRYQRDGFAGSLVLLIASVLAGLTVFFLLVALQGLLLNLVPSRWFARVSLFVQGVLLVALLCAIPPALSLPNLYWAMDQRPAFASWLPPVWFLGLDRWLLGNTEPYVAHLARTGLAALPASALAATLAYLWSYWRHRRRVLETPLGAGRPSPAWERIRGRIGAWVIPHPEELAVFSFLIKTLARSGHHRLALTSYAGVAIAILTAVFTWLALGPGFRGFHVRTLPLEQAALAIPLTLSLFLLTGFRYLFRLPVELRANWVFRANEASGRPRYLDGVERFLVWCGVIPIVLLTAPAQFLLLGTEDGLVSTLLTAMTMLILVELILFEFRKIPFACSYLPGKRNLVETMLLFGAGSAAYIAVLSRTLAACFGERPLTVAVLGLLIAAWAYLRAARIDAAVLGKLEYEEEFEPAVRTLDLAG